MAVFTVHIPPSVAGEAPPAEKIMFLREGFSWSAAMLGPLWLLWNRAFLATLGWAALLALVVFAGAKLGFDDEAITLVNFALALALGFEGERLLAWTLARRGYHECAVVVGESLDEAEEVFFRGRSRAPAPSAGALGA